MILVIHVKCPGNIGQHLDVLAICSKGGGAGLMSAFDWPTPTKFCTLPPCCMQGHRRLPCRTHIHYKKKPFPLIYSITPRPPPICALPLFFSFSSFLLS